MITIILFCCLFAMMLPLTGCQPTATAIGTSNVPINYTYSPGFNPPQVLYPVPTDADHPRWSPSGN